MKTVPRDEHSVAAIWEVGDRLIYNSYGYGRVHGLILEVIEQPAEHRYFYLILMKPLNDAQKIRVARGHIVWMYEDELQGLEKLTYVSI